jgi:DNA ligase-1
MERLIRQDKHGNDRYIDIKVEDLKDGTADIVKISGVVGNEKFSESRTNVKTGYEKALKRAQTMWNNEHTKCNQVLPMLANKWEDRKKYISEPFYVQPKLDGVRLLVSKDGGISRTGKVVPGTEILGKGLEEGQYVDGEAFDPNLNFEELTSTFKTDPLKLKFHVFDFFDLKKLDMTFEERWEKVKSLKNSHYEYVETTLVMLRDHLPMMHEKHVKEGHEGTMIRDMASVYEVGRPKNTRLLEPTRVRVATQTRLFGCVRPRMVTSLPLAQRAPSLREKKITRTVRSILERCSPCAFKTLLLSASHVFPLV